MFVLNANQPQYLPKPMNSNGNFTTSYPQPFFDGYCAQAGPTSIYGTISTNVSKGIADHAVVETVGATSINKYFRKLTDAMNNSVNLKK